MRAVVQRVKKCTVETDGKIVGEIKSGLLVYLGIEKGDTQVDREYLARKITALRVFEDNEGKMNLSVCDIEDEILVVSQFTLCADTRKGNRPSYNNAEEPFTARKMYESFIIDLEKYKLHVSSGKFQAHMEIQYINYGPVTILLDSRKTF